MRKKNRIVYRNNKNEWVNKRVDSNIVSSIHKTQREAISAALKMLTNSGGGLLIVKSINGRILSTDSISSKGKRNASKPRTIKANPTPTSFTREQANDALISLHVVADKNSKGWDVKRILPSPKARSFSSKTRAIEYAKKVLLKENRNIIVHDRSGRIVQKLSYRTIAKESR